MPGGRPPLPPEERERRIAARKEARAAAIVSKREANQSAHVAAQASLHAAKSVKLARVRAREEATEAVRSAAAEVITALKMADPASIAACRERVLQKMEDILEFGISGERVMAGKTLLDHLPDINADAETVSEPEYERAILAEADRIRAKGGG